MSLNHIHIITPEQVSLNFKLAGLGSRATANILDWFLLILVTVGFPLSLVIIAKDRPHPTPVPPPTTTSNYVLAIMIILLFLLLWGYFVFFEYFSSGRTPGKMLVGIRVIQDNGQSITFLASAVRNLFRIIDFLPALFLLGILMIFFHSQHKRIGDLAAGTLVVYNRKIKRKKKNNPLEKEIEKRLITQQISLEISEWSKTKIGIREWELLKTYMMRRASLSLKEREKMTLQVAGILFPLLDVDVNVASKPLEEVENYLFTLYLQLREDWQYEDE